MSDILDKLASELQQFSQASPANGGISGVIGVQSIQKGDPGFLTVSEYPYLMVEVESITPKSETMGRAGYVVLNHVFEIAILADVTEFYDPDEVGNDAEGPLEDAGIAMYLWFLKLANRRLDELVNVRNVSISGVDFPKDERGEVYVKRARLLLTVERQHQHTP